MNSGTCSPLANAQLGAYSSSFVLTLTRDAANVGYVGTFTIGLPF